MSSIRRLSSTVLILGMVFAAAGCRSTVVHMEPKQQESSDPLDPNAKSTSSGGAVKVTASMNEDCKRGVAYLSIEEWEKSIPCFQNAIAKNAEDHRAHFGLGVAHEQLGDKAKAKKEYDTAFMLSPDDEQYRQAYLRVK